MKDYIDDEKKMTKRQQRKADDKRYEELCEKAHNSTLTDEEHDELWTLRRKEWNRIDVADKRIAIGIIIAIFVIPMAIFIINLCTTKTISHRAWERHLYIEEYGSYVATGRSLPDNSELIDQKRVYDGTTTSYSGNGVYTHHDRYHTEYTYNTVGWHIVDDRVTKGVDTEPYWAELEFNLPTDVESPKAGDLRVREGTCYYWITFEGSDALKIAPSYEIWTTLQPGDKFSYWKYISDYVEN